MTSPRMVQNFVQDIFDAMANAEEFGRAFRKDDKTVFAAIRALEIIGEAAKKIPAGRKTWSVPNSPPATGKTVIEAGMGGIEYRQLNYPVHAGHEMVH